VAMAFDTHAAIKHLTNEGIKENQAEAIIKVMQENMDENIVTRPELRTKFIVSEKKLEERLGKKIDNLENKLDRKISNLEEKMHHMEIRLEEKMHQIERRLMLMIGGAVVTTCTIIIGALKYL
jgi:hypothetical protein